MWIPILSLAAALILPTGQSPTPTVAQEIAPRVESLTSQAAAVYAAARTTRASCSTVVIDSYDPAIQTSQLVSTLFLDAQFTARYHFSDELNANDVRVEIFSDIEHEGANNLTASWNGHFFTERNIASKDIPLLAAKVVRAVEEVCRPAINFGEARLWPYSPRNVQWEGHSYCVKVRTSWASESTITNALRANNWIRQHSISLHDPCEPTDRVIELRHILGTVDWPFRILESGKEDEIYSSYVSAYEERRAAERLGDALTFVFAKGDVIPPRPKSQPKERWHAKRLAVSLGEETGGLYDVRFEDDRLVGTDDTGRQISIPISALVDARVEGRTSTSLFQDLLVTPEEFESGTASCDWAAAFCALGYFAAVIPTQFIRIPDKRIIDVTWEDPLGQQEISFQIMSGDARRLERAIDQISRIRRYRMHQPAQLQPERQR